MNSLFEDKFYIIKSCISTYDIEKCIDLLKESNSKRRQKIENAYNQLEGNLQRYQLEEKLNSDDGREFLLGNGRYEDFFYKSQAIFNEKEKK